MDGFIKGLTSGQSNRLMNLVSYFPYEVTEEQLANILTDREIMPKSPNGHLSLRLKNIFAHCKTQGGYNLVKFDRYMIK